MIVHPPGGSTPLDHQSRATVENMFNDWLDTQTQVDAAWAYVINEWKRTGGRFYAYNVACLAIAEAKRNAT